MRLRGGLLNPLTVPAHILALLGARPSHRPAGCGLAAHRRLAAFALALAAGLAAIALALGQTPAVDVLLVATAVSGLMLALALALPNVRVRRHRRGCRGGARPRLPAAGHPHGGRDAGIGRNLDRRVHVRLAVAAACASRLTRDWQRIGVRIVGSWIAASAILVLALRFARGMLFAM